MDFGNSYQVEFLARAVPGRAQGDTGEIYSVGYADGGATEYPVIAGEGYNEIDVPAERMAEQLVRVQLHFLHAGRIFMVIGICGYLQQHSYTLLFQHPHEVYGKGIGVVIGADIYALYAFPANVLQDRGKRQPFFYFGGYSFAQIGKHIFVYHPLPATVVANLVVAGAYICPHSLRRPPGI